MPFKRAAGEVFNILPDRMNLFLRYMSGVGDEGLELDKSTLRSIRQATERTPVVEERLKIPAFMGKPSREVLVPGISHGPGLPTSGPHGSYGSGDKAVTQTLGRFNAEVMDDGSVRITDQYDMENEFEDPDLVSGKFQPKKALLQVQSIYDPEARAEIIRMSGQNVMRPPMDNRDYGQQFKDASKSDTSSPMTALARAALYLSPFKPKPFDIDVTIPPTTR